MVETAPPSSRKGRTMRNGALWRLRPYLRPYQRQMFLITFAALTALVAAAFIPQATKSVIDGPIADGDRRGIGILVLLVLALGLFEGFMSFLRRYVLAAVANGIENNLRNDLYAHLQRLPVAFHDQWQTGQLLSRAMADINVIRRFLGFGLVFMVVNTVTFLLVLTFLVRLHAVLALVVAVSAVPIFGVSRWFNRRYRGLSRLLQDKTGDLTTLVEEAATGIRVVKAFGRHRLMERRFEELARRVYDSNIEMAGIRGIFYASLSAVPNMTLAFVLLGGGYAVANGSLTEGGLIAFTTWLLMLVWPIEALGEIIAMGEEASTAADRIFEVLDTKPEIADRPNAYPLAAVEGRVTLEGVSFSYPGTDTEILRDVNLEVRPGETLAIVGVTGSGKTTLATLVPRLYDVTGGHVAIDGHDVRDVTLASLRRHIGVAFEDPILFSASVRENLLLGHPNATDDDIEVALSTAQADFVHHLPWGLDTRVGEQGLSLSGGQRQRLALARAIIGRPQVLVLDDPLSALDVHTEALVEEALRRVLDGVTALLVVHRPSTLALADRVALLADGTIVAVGTHSELMATNPTYRDILSQEAEEAEAHEAHEAEGVSS